MALRSLRRRYRRCRQCEGWWWNQDLLLVQHRFTTIGHMKWRPTTRINRSLLRQLSWRLRFRRICEILYFLAFPCLRSQPYQFLPSLIINKTSIKEERQEAVRPLSLLLRSSSLTCQCIRNTRDQPRKCHAPFSLLPVHKFSIMAEAVWIFLIILPETRRRSGPQARLLVISRFLHLADILTCKDWTILKQSLIDAKKILEHYLDLFVIRTFIKLFHSLRTIEKWTIVSIIM